MDREIPQPVDAAIAEVAAPLLDPFLDGANPTRSPIEDDFKAFCARHGLPTPLINVRVAGHIADALFPAEKLIVELDSWEFHKDRHAFERDRQRDADTLQAGHVTVRLTHPRLHDQGRPGRGGLPPAGGPYGHTGASVSSARVYRAARPHWSA